MATINSQDNTNLDRQLYSPLDDTQPEIRLIEILPSTSGDQSVCCRLETVKLSDDLRYAALSYVWGDPNVTENITVNGIVIPVTANLDSALRQFRKSGFPENKETRKLQRLWADAICINQQDNEERSSQVTLMGKLYRNASSVLSWLGPPGLERQDEALKIIRRIVRGASVPPSLDSDLSAETSSSSSEQYNKQTQLAFRSLIHILGYSVKIRGATPNRTWRSLEALGMNVYWNRVWVIQEMVLAKSPLTHWFLCGDESITFAELDRYVSLLDNLRKLPTPLERDVNSIEEAATLRMIRSPSYSMIRLRTMKLVGMVMQSWAQEEPKAPPQILPDILWFMVAAKCTATDPRDMIYGLLGMAPNNRIQPNYGQSVKNVFIEAFSYGPRIPVDLWLQHSSCDSKSNNKHRLPSWLPDLGELHQRSSELFIDPREGRLPLLKIAGALQPEIPREDTLRVQGVVCDRVNLVKRLNLRPEDSNPDKVLYQLCVDYLIEFQSVTPNEHLRSLLDDLADFESGENDYKKRPLQALIDVLDWTEKDKRRKSINYQGFSGPKISSLSWAVLDILDGIDNIDALTRDEQEDAVKRLGLADVDNEPPLNTYLCICLVGVEIPYGERKNEYDSIPEWPEFAGFSARHELPGILSRADGKTLFKTDRGKLGIGPLGMKQGDLVCAIDECTLPVVLRREENMNSDASFFEHVGTCYALGLSNGEPGDMVEKGKLELQTFEIR